ncbi:GDP-mannose:glycolipid 4-beta-D-mannosyltransferase [Halomicronema hongdechloris C2206]|uniref:GDP-mannose:glycolipid 4-beta-D-mannosyltransferase n=1 Tax=Halomicronema hongdechloris C2206 TaxID=1641165 RepID=A0A1Z3HPG0_9CYAN|nr:glycosyltransferase [Halomicronema hongdechloris]ASC72057.1 GDP-mannose:glycolipid 4-beta-D-mannosyltransferase [Halomicronema hongdechloris C2206]
MTGALRIVAWPAHKKCYKNPYPCLLYSQLNRHGVDVREFQFSSSLQGPFHILHIHWPLEDLLDPNRPWQSRVKVLGVLLILRYMRWRGTRLVWTIHNLQPHDAYFPTLQAWFWRQFIPLLHSYISLSQTIAQQAQHHFPQLARLPKCIIPHGHYRDAYPNDIDRAAAKARLGIPVTTKVLLFLGLIRPYKNVPALIKQFRHLPVYDWQLVVAGQPISETMASQVQQAANQDPRVQLHLDFIDNDRLQVFFNAANLVVLPFSQIANSGSALLALSYNCPILVPSLGALKELQTQVGTSWVQTYQPDLNASDLQRALHWAITTLRPAQAPLDPFEWSVIGRQTLACFKAIAS